MGVAVSLDGFKDDSTGRWRSVHTLSSAVPICSLKYCCVRAAKGVKEELLPVNGRKPFSKLQQQ